jgi:3-dehydroquinate synthase
VKSLTVTVEGVTTRSPVWVGRGLLGSLPSLANVSSYTKIAVIGDSGAEKVSQTVCQILNLSQDRLRTFTGGESCKRVEDLQNVWEFFTLHRLDRRSLVLAVGGGAVSDLVGFAAATYMRGIAYIPVPTTLLAQVDASIGGKSGINFGGAKNILGVIRQPNGIVVDVDTLSTLPTRDFRSGFAEIVKHGLIIDRSYFDRVTSRDCTTWSADELVDIIFRSCEIKRDIVEADESEQGVRKTLNFGHTLGHAIEAYGMANGVSITHGEAVAIGMNAASVISHRQGLLSKADQQMIIDGLTTVGLPVQLPTAMDPERLMDLVSLDKKNVGGKTRWTLLEGLGKAVHDRDVSDDAIIEAIAAIQPQSGR